MHFWNDIGLIFVELYSSRWPHLPSVGKQKGLDDDRGNLIFEFIRVVNECKPKMFIFENVKGLTTQDGGKTFEHV
jgi:site-specific DNA-cytosine methylase